MNPLPWHSQTPEVSPEQAAVMARAAVGFRTARRAAGVARFSGWTLAVFAAVTALGGLADPFTLGVAVALGVLAFSEFRGARGVQLLDAAAPRRLVANQVALLVLIVVYSAVNTARALLAEAPAGLEPTGDAQVDGVLAEVGDLVRLVAAAVYIGVGVVGVPVQAAMIAYHRRRGRQLRECLDRTPEWAVRVARAA